VLQSCPPQTDWQGIYHKLRKWGNYLCLCYTIYFSFCRLYMSAKLGFMLTGPIHLSCISADCV
jgi:hypothetical protein